MINNHIHIVVAAGDLDEIQNNDENDNDNARTSLNAMEKNSIRKWCSSIEGTS